MLNLPDFRAAERAFSLVAQVAGRAGRGRQAGRVLVQTWQPDHYALEAARTHDYDSFYAKETAFRRELDYPPFFDLVALRLDGANQVRLGAAADEIGARLRQMLGAAAESGACHVLGPVPAPMEKIRNRWRMLILVKTRPLEAATGPLRAGAALLHDDRPGSRRPPADRRQSAEPDVTKRRAPMNHALPFPARPHSRNVLLLFIVLLPLFFGRLSDLRLPMWDDLTHAAMGKEILVTGDWFTMHSNGAPSWIKPPLYFWLEAGIFSLFGASEYGARFPSALCGYLCAILIYLLARRLFGRRTAFLAIVVTATSFLFVKYSRRAMIDVPAAFATTLGAYALVRAEKRDSFYLLYGLAIALGYYFKAVQGMYLVLIGPAYLLFSGQWRRLFNPWFLAANLGAAGLIALWAVPQALLNGDTFLFSQSALGPALNRG